jgi:hypothetical protein
VVVLPRAAVEVDLPLDLEVVIPLEISTVLQLGLFDLGFPTFYLVLHVSFACEVFLDHPQKNIWVSWRGSQPSPVRVSKNKNLKEKLGLIKTRLD